MSSPKKPVFNPFQARPLPNSAPRENIGMTHPAFDSAGTKRPEGYRRQAKRGISVVGTEERLPGLSMRRAVALSLGLHLFSPPTLVALIIVLLMFLSWLLNLDLLSWLRPQPKQDVTFTLVAESDVPPPEKPLFKGQYNQRAGGQQNPKQPLKAMTEPEAMAPSKPPPAAAKPVPPSKPTPPVTPKPPEPIKQAAQPKAAPKVPVPTIRQPGKKTAPDPVANANKPDASPPEPSVRSGPDSALLASNSAASAMSGRSGSPSNPQSGLGIVPGVDVVQDADYGPFMADLERRIKRNWVPPRGSESRRVKLLFYLARDGRVVKIETKTSSGDPDADQAAIEAVEASAPFMALPAEAQEEILPVEFTFDYNVLNPRNAKQALKW